MAKLRGIHYSTKERLQQCKEYANLKCQVCDKIAKAKQDGKQELWDLIEWFGLVKVGGIKGYIRLNDKQVEIIKKRQKLKEVEENVSR